MTLRATTTHRMVNKHDNENNRFLLKKPEQVLEDMDNFDVQIGLTQDDGVQIVPVTNIVNRWMNDEFGQCLETRGWATQQYAQFGTIILLQRASRRRLDDGTNPVDEPDDEEGQDVLIGDLYTAKFKGAALFSKEEGQMDVPEIAIEDCQQRTLIQNQKLLERLQASDSTGLGTAVVNAQAYVTSDSGSSSSTSGDSLEVVIIVAIAIACVAFLFLLFAIFWAWRYDKRNRRAFLAENRKSTTDETFDANNSPESKEKPTAKVSKKAPVLPAYPSVIGGESQADGGVYPESVISEDIQSSLSQYYTGGAAGNYNYTNGRLQDAASVSSMESYGYSLDGYTPSLVTPMPAGKRLPTEPANTEAWADTKDMLRTDESGSDWGISTDYLHSAKPAATHVTPRDAPGDIDMDEKEVPPPTDAENMSMMASTIADESAIHTTIDMR